MTTAELEKHMALIRGTTEYRDFAASDVVIEAVFENVALKKKVFVQLDSVCKVGAIIATNTSTLDVAEIATAIGRPSDVVGLHFFSPAQVMRLLEIVRTPDTANDVLASSMQLAKKLRKVGVLSGNSYGFIGNRMMDPYGREAEHLLLEGATPRRIDDVLQRFGMAMGILAVYDMAGVDVGYKVRQERKDQCRTIRFLSRRPCWSNAAGSAKTGAVSTATKVTERQDNLRPWKCCRRGCALALNSGKFPTRKSSSAVSMR
jgi:3-hydroxyacyl-CoA dehydrogenase